MYIRLIDSWGWGRWNISWIIVEQVDRLFDQLAKDKSRSIETSIECRCSFINFIRNLSKYMKIYSFSSMIFWVVQLSNRLSCSILNYVHISIHFFCFENTTYDKSYKKDIIADSTFVVLQCMIERRHLAHKFKPSNSAFVLIFAIKIFNLNHLSNNNFFLFPSRICLFRLLITTILSSTN